MRHIEASITKRQKDSHHGISFKYNEKRKSVEVGSITGGSLFAKTSIRKGDVIIVMDKISFKGNVADKMNKYMDDVQGKISVLAIRYNEEPKRSTFNPGAQRYAGEGCEGNDCCVCVIS